MSEINTNSKFGWGVVIAALAGVAIYYTNQQQMRSDFIEGIIEAKKEFSKFREDTVREISEFKSHTSKIEERLSSIDTGVSRMIGTVELLRDTSSANEGRDNLQDQRLGELEKRLEKLEDWKALHRND